jgi:hypothetical protein
MIEEVEWTPGTLFLPSPEMGRRRNWLEGGLGGDG